MHTLIIDFEKYAYTVGWMLRILKNSETIFVYPAAYPAPYPCILERILHCILYPAAYPALYLRCIPYPKCISDVSYHVSGVYLIVFIHL